MRRVHPLLLLAVLTSPVACDDDPTGTSAIEGELARSRTVWEATGPDDYELTLQRLCECIPDVTRAVVVSVRDGRVTAIRYLDNGTAVPPSVAALFFDVDGLFEVIEEAVDDDAHAITVTYDPTLGYPTHVLIDFDENVVDEELLFQVLALNPAEADEPN